MTKHLEAPSASLVLFHPLFTQPDTDEGTWRPAPSSHLSTIQVYAISAGKKMFLRHYAPGELASELDVGRDWGGGMFVAHGIANALGAAADPEGKLRCGGILALHHFTLPGALRSPPPPAADPAAAPPPAPSAPGEIGGTVGTVLAVVAGIAPFLLEFHKASAGRDARAQELADAREARAEERAAALAAESRTAAAAQTAALAAQSSALIQALVARPVTGGGDASPLDNFRAGMVHGAAQKPAETSIMDDLTSLAQVAPMVVGVLRAAMTPGAS